MNENVRANYNAMLKMPEESETHKRTWLSFVANDTIWAKKQIPEVKRNLVLLAKTIAQYEPVSMIVNPLDYDEALLLLGDLHGQQFSISLIESDIDDLWLRDTAPTFVKDTEGNKLAIDFNFNGWGEKQEHRYDSKIAKFIAKQSQTSLLSTDLVIEGGSFEIDGHGTAILTKSSVLNANRNPHLTQLQVENELKTLLGLRKIIWFEGIKGKDITDAHIDFYARFTKKGEVVVSRDNYQDSYDYEITRNNIDVLKNSTDADGNLLKVTIMDTPNIINEQFGVNDFAAGYIGYYVCNNAVIMQSFGDEVADAKAYSVLTKAFPDRTIEQIRVDGIASGGGSIHCATQQEIA